LCYFLYVASPLTLSEVRSMLPAGLTADLAPSHRAALHLIHPSSRTVAQLLIGACSCDLVRARQANPIDDERELRARYHRLRVPRADIIRALERHRRGPIPRPTTIPGWPQALVHFVAEHARNAGPTLYLLEFRAHPERIVAAVGAPIVTRSLGEVRSHSGHWLTEDTPTLVEPSSSGSPPATRF
jgi:hypothetical protein